MTKTKTNVQLERLQKLKQQFMSKTNDWKTGNYIDELEEIVQTLDEESMESYCQLIIPMVLRVLDDHEPLNKRKGVLISEKLVVCWRSYLKTSGMGMIFFEAIMICTTYLDYPELVDDALRSLSQLVSVIHQTNSIEYFDLLERIMNDAILKMLAYCIGGKAELVKILFEHATLLLKPIGILSFKYLHQFSGTACEVLELYVSHPYTQLTAITLLKELFIICKSRMSDYGSRILTAIVNAWLNMTLKDTSTPKLKCELKLLLNLVKLHPYPKLTNDIKLLESLEAVQELLH
ncbi:hypothetical protein BC833DRAFT_578939 [Globomyces pollinis-pini]|nr:hypothetical protein BC833DRAFT_578939 [Globomyces pollinis-pini]